MNTATAANQTKREIVKRGGSFLRPTLNWGCVAEARNARKQQTNETPNDPATIPQKVAGDWALVI
jgi:hypothetical protein